MGYADSMDYKVFLEGPGRVCRGISVRLIARPVLFCAGRRTRTTFQIKVGYLLAAHGFVLGSGEIGEGNWSPRVRVRHVSSEPRILSYFPNHAIAERLQYFP